MLEWRDSGKESNLGLDRESGVRRSWRRGGPMEMNQAITLFRNFFAFGALNEI